ncbi:helix-turn-helix domain-containing protein [Methylobacterium sp. J-030]|uniref:helix-turn-helix domain-containing protein n=1 Tax=Methylobacterium sp. J-030 TaxID=2836627 RepID=UPI001FB9D744|nr:helix-turn-helix domain-containing protein [Methylobacterium sp. J-030]MCJ2068437.1 helix-turn-helix domain-containing protein [Methylobacterium sp. J-030]
MQPLFSTIGLHPRNSFPLWRDILRQQSLPIEAQRLDDTPFEGRLDIAEIGSILLTRIAQSSVRSEVTPELLRRLKKGDTLVVLFKLAGTLTVQQGERVTEQRAGDLVVIDHRPAILTTGPGSQSLFLELPRERLENLLGPARLYTALTIGADLGATTLVTTFFQDLIRVRRELTPDAADRMTAIGGDLIVASIAERLAQEVPQPLYGTVVVQRAKAYVETHLHEPGLDAPGLAGALGVSLRRLQELFHARGQHISDYIWQRRLETAARHLADPTCAPLAIGVLAHKCGFANQAHFARRFRACHGMTPREYRQAAVVGAP